MKINWFLYTAHKHTEKSVKYYLDNQALSSEYSGYHLEDGREVKVMSIPIELVERITTDSDMNKHSHFYIQKEGISYLEPVSTKDAYRLVTGKEVSGKAVSEMFDTKAREAFARKILLKAQSLVEKAKEGKKKVIHVAPLREYYKKEPTSLSDLKGTDKTIADFLKRQFSVTIEKPKKNTYFTVRL